MQRSLRMAMAAVTAGAAVLSAAAPAAARDHRHWQRHHDDNDVAAAAVVAGVLGLAIGAAIMSSKRSKVAYAVQPGDYVSLPPVEDEAYAPPYDEAYGAPAPAVCTTESWSWDRDSHRQVRVMTSTPC